jgi:MFS family permease
MAVVANSAVTELFPTALRGTIMGWLTLCVAFSAVGAQITIAVLAHRMGGLSNVVGWLALLTMPSAIIWGLFIDETRGLSKQRRTKSPPPRFEVRPKPPSFRPPWTPRWFSGRSQAIVKIPKTVPPENPVRDDALVGVW